MSRYKKYKKKAFEKKADFKKFKKQKKNYFPPTLIVKTGNINDLMLDYEIPSSILNNVWNVHHVRTDPHSKIVIAAKDGQYFILPTTTEKTNKKAKIQLKDGLVEQQESPTFVLVNGHVIDKSKLQKREKDKRVTERDKNYIYSSIKNRKTNVIKYNELMNK